MREIIFRAKNYRTGQWVYGIYFKNPVSRFNEGAYYPQIIPEIHGVHDTIERCSIVEDTLGQFTGLTDKNGVKIFEGDILESFYKKKRIVSVVKYGGFEPEIFYECAEAQGFFLHGMKLYGLYAYDLAGSEMMLTEDMRQAKIIGNVYDNPELLRGVDK